MRQVRAGIIGGAGYAGGEMIRLLINHPGVDIRFIHSKSNAGKYVYEIHEDLLGDTELKFDESWHNEVDVVFLCLGHGESKKFIEESGAGLDGVLIIDLSQDYRLHTGGERPPVNGHPFVYGLPELNREEIRSAHGIANPGCFATAIQLGLLPLAKAGSLDDIYTTGITGSTGAGQGLNATSHFSWRANNIQAYKTLTHQHLAEIGQSFLQLNPSGDVDLSFIPWRGDFTRGIFISSQIKCDLGIEELTALYNEYYASHPFVSLSSGPIFLKQVVNTNKCFIQLEKV